MIWLRRFWPVLLGLVLVLIISRTYLNQFASNHFVDEDDNFVTGKYLLDGRVLYSELFSHHQPLLYIFSAGVQKFSQPNSIYLLVKNHRLVIIVWSAFWMLLLVGRFRTVALVSLTIFELTKFKLFGHLFLAESMVVYPLIYLTGLILTRPKLRVIENIAVGTMMAICLMSLSPIWPLVFGLFGLIFWQQRNRRQFALLSIAGGLPVLTFVSFFISIPDYFFEAFYINFKYYIPITSTDNSLILAMKSLVTPLTVFRSDLTMNPTLLEMRVVSVGLVVVLVSLWNYKQRVLVGLILLILTLANFRYVTPGTEMYNGFHILPWYGLILFCWSYGSFFLLTHTKSYLLKVAIWMVIIGAIGVAWSNANNSIFIRKNVLDELFIGYSKEFDIGQAVKIMKVPGERLFVAPADSLVYWQADITPASKMIFYYAWMIDAPPLRLTVDQMFAQNPPDYLYTDLPGTGLEKYYPSYDQLEKDGNPTSLFIRQGKWQMLTDQQKNSLNYLNFSRMVR